MSKYDIYTIDGMVYVAKSTDMSFIRVKMIDEIVARYRKIIESVTSEDRERCGAEIEKEKRYKNGCIDRKKA